MGWWVRYRSAPDPCHIDAATCHMVMWQLMWQTNSVLILHSCDGSATCHIEGWKREPLGLRTSDPPGGGTIILLLSISNKNDVADVADVAAPLNTSLNPLPHALPHLPHGYQKGLHKILGPPLKQ